MVDTTGGAVRKAMLKFTADPVGYAAKSNLKKY